MSKRRTRAELESLEATRAAERRTAERALEEAGEAWLEAHVTRVGLEAADDTWKDARREAQRTKNRHERAQRRLLKAPR